MKILAKLALVCTLFASTGEALADDVYRCGKVYQDAPCAGGTSRPINEKPFRPSVNQQNTKHVTNHASSHTSSSENKLHAKAKRMVGKRKPIAAPEPETQVETTQNTSTTNSPTAAAQAVMAPATNPAPTTNSAPAANPAPATVVDRSIEAQPAQKVAEKEVVADEQGVCSSLNAGLKNIAEKKAKGGNTADLKQQQKNLESAKKSAGC
jgi:hypothetical protein